MSQPSKKVQPTANPSGEQRRMHSGSVPGVGSMGVPTTSTGPHATNLDTLRKIAEAATQGVWERFDVTDLDTFGVTDLAHVLASELETEDAVQAVATGVTREDAHHIATFDPPAVLALLSRIEQAEQAVARVREVIHQYDPDCLTCMCNSDGDCCKCTVADFQEALDGECRG